MFGNNIFQVTHRTGDYILNIQSNNSKHTPERYCEIHNYGKNISLNWG